MNEKIIFTTCTAAYLAQAKTLGDSIVQTNPGYRLCIGLVDKINGQFDPGAFIPHEIIEVDALHIPVFDEMSHRYSLLELCCAVKPWFALYILKNFSAKQIIYLDTDVLVTSTLQFIEEQFIHNSILLSPHILSPLPADGKRPHETGILKTGIYNAGFFGVNNDNIGNAFLNWWKNILVDYCYEDSTRGLASDQTWLNFVPLFFDNVEIIRHPGCNVAYWNLHEREVEKINGMYFINKKFPLLFFHFSGYSIHHPDKVSKHQDRFSMEENPAVQEIFYRYQSILLENKHETFRKIPFYYKSGSQGNWLKKIRWKK